MTSTRDIRVEMHSQKSPSKQVTVSWRNLNMATVPPITAKCKKDFKSIYILKDLNGIVRPGEMVALMGAR